MPTVRHKRGTSANLAAVNPVALDGEIVYDKTENAIKIGDGSTAWTSLAYVTATPRTHTHSADAITSGTVAYARLPVGSTTSTVCAGDDARLSDARTPTAHKASHATGGSDALTPADIGAASGSVYAGASGAGGNGSEWLNGTYYAGGGAGGRWGGGTVGAAGLGGGGTGGTGDNNAPGGSGTVNTGGGGGGASSGVSSSGGSGGSGVVILRTLGSVTAASTTGSPTRTESGGYTYYTFTGSGSITF